MRKSPVALVCVVVAVLSASASADDRTSCLEQVDDNLAIQGCSEIISQNPKNATAYYKRGAAFARRGDTDRAIADYSKAIEIKPTYGAAYDSRGLAYVSKGDYTRAVADVTKAGELTPNIKQQAKGSPAAPGKPKVSSWKSSKNIDANVAKGGDGGGKFRPFGDTWTQP